MTATTGAPATTTMKPTRQGVLTARIMPGVPYIAVAITRFVTLKMVELLRATIRYRPL